MEPRVFKDGDAAGSKGVNNLRRRRSNTVGCKLNRLADKAGKLFRHGLEGILFIGARLGPAEVREHYDARAALG